MTSSILLKKKKRKRHNLPEMKRLGKWKAIFIHSTQFKGLDPFWLLCVLLEFERVDLTSLYVESWLEWNLEQNLEHSNCNFILRFTSMKLVVKRSNISFLSSSSPSPMLEHEAIGLAEFAYPLILWSNLEA